MFKKLSGLALVAGTFMLVAGAAQAGNHNSPPSWFNAPSSGQFDVAGVVSARCAIEVNDLSTTLDLQTGETGAQVAIIKESCNSGSGYTISFSSANGGEPLHEFQFRRDVIRHSRERIVDCQSRGLHEILDPDRCRPP